MKLKLLCGIFVVASLLLSPETPADQSLLTAKFLPRVEQVRLWTTYIQGKANPAIFDGRSEAKFEVIENLVLVRQVKGLTAFAAAFGTVCMQPGSSDLTRCALTPELFETFATEHKGETLTDKEIVKLQKLCAEAIDTYWSRHPGLKNKVVMDGTFGIRDAKLLHMTYGRKESVTDCLREIARYHGCVPILETAESLPFQAYKESIDKGVAALLQDLGDGSLRVCCGYLATEGRSYLVVADNREISFGKRPLQHSKKDMESDSPWVRQILERDKKFLITTDFETSASKPLVDGIEIQPFQPERYRAYFIYDWRVSAEAWEPEIRKVLGLPEH